MGIEDLRRFQRSKRSMHNSVDALVSENGRLDKRIKSLRAENETLTARVKELETQKDGAYSERDKLVAALSKPFNAWLERHPESEEWEDDWRWIVFFDTPEGQLSWHIHDSELSMFDHLARQDTHSWDGHTTNEKYERLAALAAKGDDG